MTTAQTEDARRYDREGVLKDGETFTAPMLLMDAAHQDVIDATRKAITSAYEPSASLAGHRPGTMTVDGIQGELAATERQVRRDLRLDQQQELWRNPPPLEINAEVKMDAVANVTAADAETAAEARDARIRDAWKGM
jgi:hypothetical protein